MTVTAALERGSSSPARTWTMPELEDLGRIRLSPSFFMRDFLYSEVAVLHGLRNVPDDPDLAIEAGTRLCTELLEPLQRAFGRIAVRSGYRSCEVNQLGHDRYRRCAANERNHARHIWDRRDAGGHLGATACIVVPWLVDRFSAPDDWQRMAWWIHEHLPYSRLCFYPKLWAFNISWHERPARTIYSFVEPKGLLTAPWMANHSGSHGEWYEGFPEV